MGSFPGGATHYGARDLLGNVAEWTKTDFTRGDAPLFGGHYDTPPEELAADASPSAPFADRSPQVGFRVRLPVKMPE